MSGNAIAILFHTHKKNKFESLPLFLAPACCEKASIQERGVGRGRKGTRRGEEVLTQNKDMGEKC